MKYDKLNRQNVDPLNDPVEIWLLGHHVGVFTDYFVRDSTTRDELFSKQGDNYSTRFVSNEIKVYRILLENSNATVKVIFYGPDSICFPSGNAFCKKCIKKMVDELEGPGKDESYSTFMKAAHSVHEAENVLFYDGLTPGELQNQSQFIKSISETGEKIMEIYNSDGRTTYRGYDPYSLGFLSDYKKILETYFPQVLKLNRTELYEIFIGTFLSKSVCGVEPSKSKIKKAIEEYPEVLSGNPKKIYESILKSI